MSQTLELLDPTTLVVGVNIREAASLDPLFLASIRERGVLEPVLAHRDDTGSVIVDQGQRRAIAAAQLGLPSIPVVVADHTPADVDRLVDQWVENEHRASLSNTERARAVEQMALIGLSVSQIAKRTATRKAAVETAAAVARSATALEHADTLTLEDAAVLAEFDGDQDATDQLLQQAKWGHGLAVSAERLRGDRAEQKATAAKAAELTGQGITVIEPVVYGDTKTQRLENLRDGRKKIDVDQHATACPGHVVWVTASARWEREPGELVGVHVTPGCTGWAKRGHASLDQYGKPKAADMAPAEQEQARKERRHVIDSNKDWKAATTVRRRWLAQFAQRKTAPDGAEALVAAAIAGGWRSEVSMYASTSSAFELLSTSKEALVGELATATPKRALQIALAVTVASWEASITDSTWRVHESQHAVDVRVLAAISQWGHDLSAIETAIVDGTAATAP